jgi:hypothetical protein
LLNQTSVIFGTSLGNGDSHAKTTYLPWSPDAVSANAQHLALGGKHDYPLPNQSVSVLQRLGIEADLFATSTGTIRRLEFKT